MKKLVTTLLILATFIFYPFSFVYANTYSVEFSGSNSAYRNDESALEFGNDANFTVECWFNLDTFTGLHVCATKFNGATNNKSWMIGPQLQSGTNNDWIRLQTSNDGSSNPIVIVQDTGQDFSTGTWYHIAVSFQSEGDDQATIEFYLNGSSVNTLNNQGDDDIYDGNARLEIGALNSGGGNFLDGHVDEVRIWSDVRTDAEIADNYDQELTGGESDLLAYYKFENDYTDETSNALDLTANGTPTFETDVPFAGGGGGGDAPPNNFPLYLLMREKHHV